MTSYDALLKLNTLYVKFLRVPRLRKTLFDEISTLTDIVCADEKVLSRIKQKAQERVIDFEGML